MKFFIAIYLICALIEWLGTLWGVHILLKKGGVYEDCEESPFYAMLILQWLAVELLVALVASLFWPVCIFRRGEQFINWLFWGWRNGQKM